MAQTLSDVKAKWQLSGTMATAANNTSGSIVIGNTSSQSKTWDDADILYAMKITSNAGSDVATLTLSSGTVAQTTGTPEVERWGTQTADLTGEDIHGVTLATMVTCYAIELFTPDVQTGSVIVASSATEGPDVGMPQKGRNLTLVEGGFTSPGTVAFTFANAAESVNVIVTGKST